MAVTNFGGEEVVSDYDESEIIIIPVPYDATSTYIRGADRGPAAILEASRRLSFMIWRPGRRLTGKGYSPSLPLVPDLILLKLPKRYYKTVSGILAGDRFPVVIGGNHTVSIGAFRAAAEVFHGLTILQLDAHSDLRPVYEGSPLNHACAAARAKEYAPLVQVGIRSMAAEELPFADRQRIFYAHELWADKSLYKKALRPPVRECLYHSRPGCL